MFIATIFLAPIVEEFLYRGLMLQKWGLKWGVRWGVILSSLVFAIYHFRFDVISLFIGGVFFSILYIRTSNLFAPILCHGLYNSIVVAWSTVVFLSQSVTEREAIISISEYQNSVAPLLSQYVLLTILSSLCLLYLFYKNLPRGIQKVPYLKNQELKYD